MDKVKKDKVYGLGQISTPKSMPVGTVKVHNMLDHAKSVGAFGADMYSTGHKLTLAPGSGNKHITLVNTKNVPAPMSLKIKQTGKSVGSDSRQFGNKTQPSMMKKK